MFSEIGLSTLGEIDGAKCDGGRSAREDEGRLLNLVSQIRQAFHWRARFPDEPPHVARSGWNHLSAHQHGSPFWRLLRLWVTAVPRCAAASLPGIALLVIPSGSLSAYVRPRDGQLLNLGVTKSVSSCRVSQSSVSGTGSALLNYTELRPVGIRRVWHGRCSPDIEGKLCAE